MQRHPAHSVRKKDVITNRCCDYFHTIIVVNCNVVSLKMNNFKILKSWLIQAFAVKFFTSQPSYIILRQEVSMLDEINIGFPLFASQEIRYVLSHRYTDLVFKDLFFPGRTSSSQVITTCWSLAVQLYSRTLSNNQCAPGQIKLP